ncbi:non-canonical purine NTP pyrophosphatase [Granulicella sp. dw_53]|uniref:non-canonical purine NTP pyrophosphatase n=1 Tax=Granulicella sp. dw_53 TaxID=2719792 RepID=UPI001BD1CC42|nr:non-canonical purine NTP pyrophosphatase [Granulicella sp. dw_53]
MILYVATTNPGKLRDFATATADTTLADHITILPLPGLQSIPAPIEDEPTFEGNAILKACFYSLHAPGHIVLADDSGLEVDALDGAPGVRSARYAEDVAYPTIDSTLPLDTRNNLTLLQALSSTSAPHTARYRCVLAAARDGETLHTASGTIEGEILSTPQGAGGFGYDPLFYLPEHHLTMAQLDPITRLTLSHRGRALTALLRMLHI